MSPSLKSSNAPRSLTPLAAGFILSAATSWGVLVPDPQFAPPVANPYGLVAIPGTGFFHVETADMDADGDVDVLVASGGLVRLYRNTGSPSAPAFAASTPLFSPPVESLFNCMGDLDGDGDMDAFVRTYDDPILIYPNTGNSTNPAFGPPSQLFPGYYHFIYSTLGMGTQVVDLDGDGDVDCFSANQYLGLLMFENTGNSTNPAFSIYKRQPGAFGLQTGSENLPGRVDFADIDGDGDLDALSRLHLGGGRFVFQRNVGTPTSPAFTPGIVQPFGLPYPDSPSIRMHALVDLDADGDIDILAARENSSTIDIVFFQNTAPVDTTPPVPTIIVDGDSTTPSDTVAYYVQFNEPVGNTFTGADITPLAGSLSASSINVAPSPSDPGYNVYVTFADPDAAGTFAFKITTAVKDLPGNSMSIAVNSPTITITPPGDVNLSGTFDIADVALLADANLSLAVLP